MLRGLCYWLVTDYSGQHFGPIFKGKLHRDKVLNLVQQYLVPTWMSWQIDQRPYPESNLAPPCLNGPALNHIGWLFKTMTACIVRTVTWEVITSQTSKLLPSDGWVRYYSLELRILSIDDTTSRNDMLWHLAANLRTIRVVSIGLVFIIDSSSCFVSGMFNVFILILFLDITPKYVLLLTV
jgi:hypothetical protein